MFRSKAKKTYRVALNVYTKYGERGICAINFRLVGLHASTPGTAIESACFDIK